MHLNLSPQAIKRIKAQARRDMAWLKSADLLDILKYVARETEAQEREHHYGGIKVKLGDVRGRTSRFSLRDDNSVQRIAA